MEILNKSNSGLFNKLLIERSQIFKGLFIINIKKVNVFYMPDIMTILTLSRILEQHEISSISHSKHV